MQDQGYVWAVDLLSIFFIFVIFALGVWDRRKARKLLMMIAAGSVKKSKAWDVRLFGEYLEARHNSLEYGLSLYYSIHADPELKFSTACSLGPAFKVARRAQWHLICDTAYRELLSGDIGFDQSFLIAACEPDSLAGYFGQAVNRDIIRSIFDQGYSYLDRRKDSVGLYWVGFPPEKASEANLAARTLESLTALLNSLNLSEIKRRPSL